ncbi:aspartic proteinase 36-like [Telopea speciosissima]|uniref:aspartic proteinase 36-like n=1 Tax=Telopea speciosissima TaxID=54955 RepID=UPI001CC42650|nr:aspartic proteinase 36-like [Telopea speciosissima]
MDVKRFLFGFSILFLLVVCDVSANMVLNVKHKFAGQKPSTSAMKEHDSLRHQRILYDVNLPLEGNGLVNSTGLYYTQFGIGTPSKTYYVQVDTGSDVLWVNCVGCKKCPTSSSLGVNLQLYDPKASSTAQDVSCQQQFCTIANGVVPSCTASSSMPCSFSLTYGDGSSASGYYVNDVIQYGQVTTNGTSPTNTSLIFGCADTRTGNLASSNGALDGILGMGPAKTSFVSQLASAGLVSDTFAHCLAGASGDGIFVIGEVAQPKVNSTPLIPNQELYNVNMESVDVGGTALQIPASAFTNQETIIDSGTTLAYLTDAIYVPLMNAVTAQYPNLMNQTYPCLPYAGSVDTGFPTVTFNFQNSLSLTVYPHDYMIYDQGQWCILWQDSSSLAAGAMNLNILGDLVLSNKLVVYDLENSTIGWTEYNCSSSIALQTGPSGATSLVGSPANPSSAWSLDVERFITFLLLTVVLAAYFN